MPDLSGLFAPFRLRKLTLKNRIVMPAMGLAVCENGAPNDEHADYYARIASGAAELEELLAPMSEAGVDLFDCSQRRFWEPVFVGSDLNWAGWVKKVTGRPTMTIGSVGLDCDMQASLGEGREAGRDLAGLDELARRFDRGDFDLVGVGRAIIAEPDWAHIVRAGRFERLKPFSPSVIAGALQRAD